MFPGSSDALAGLLSPDAAGGGDRATLLLALRRLKRDPDSLHALRSLVAAHQPTTDVSQLDQDDLLALVADLVRRGAIRLGEAAAHGEGLSDPAEVQILNRLPRYARDFRFEGDVLRLVRAGEWRRRGGAPGHEAIDAARSVAILARIGEQAGTSAAERAALREAATLLQRVTRYSNAGLLLLRRVPVQRIIASASTPAVTPSQLARQNTKEQHWIEIILRDEDGVPVSHAAFAIITPDSQRHTGFTDADGRARIDDIVAGQCQVTFPGLDQSAWKAA